MVAEKHFTRFHKTYNKDDLINIYDIMLELQVSRPTATTLLKELLKKKKIKIFTKDDKKKWYLVN